MTILRVILGDQLNINHSWFKTIDDDVTYLMMEINSEMTYVKHHIQKIIGFINAMRAFRNELREIGHNVRYIEITNPGNEHSFIKNIKKELLKNNYSKLEWQEPDEYRLDQQFHEITDHLNIETEVFSSEHFLSDRQSVGHFFKDKKTWRMEEFYRDIRKCNLILMENDKPIGGRWNFDHDNRKKWDPKINLPVRIKFGHDVSTIFSEIDHQNISFMGDIDVNNFNWPKNRKESLQLLEHFLNNCLNDFGNFQDSMSQDNKYLFHSLISFSLNTKMLHPMEVVRQAEKKLHPDLTNLNSVEGFIRQIIGWREYIRGIYWAKMPGYDESNYFTFTNKLPSFFWNAQTDMNCLKKSIKQSLENAYAHHIQRLMILGNFMLLNETNPKYVHEWFLGIYIDAIEWVELPNVIGMSQYADGGLLATKPYVSSGAYINKMGDYCQSCKYNVKTKYEDDSCPFNSLYWNFFINNPDLLNNNPRMGIVKMQIQKMSDQDKKSITNKVKQLKKNINQL